MGASQQNARQIALDLLTNAADRGLSCPSNNEISAKIGASSPSYGAKLIASLERAGLIEVARGSSSRVVMICASGRRTAGAVTSVHWRLKDSAKAQKAAEKTRITKASKQVVVEIVDGPDRIAPRSADRTPCFMCGTRADIGCKHQGCAA